MSYNKINNSRLASERRSLLSLAVWINDDDILINILKMVDQKSIYMKLYGSYDRKNSSLRITTRGIPRISKGIHGLYIDLENK